MATRMKNLVIVLVIVELINISFKLQDLFSICEKVRLSQSDTTVLSSSENIGVCGLKYALPVLKLLYECKTGNLAEKLTLLKH